jgi:hypothetical protein
MAGLEPLYTLDNCSFCAPLKWALTVFWRDASPDASWFAELAQALDADGIRLLGHRFGEPHISQFSLSTGPNVSPLFLVNRVKDRLQYLVRHTRPKALQRNYALRSIGSATRAAVESYIASQPNRHAMADDRVQQAFERSLPDRSPRRRSLPAADHRALRLLV